MMLAVYIGIAGLGIWLVAKQYGFEKGHDQGYTEAVEDCESLLANRGPSVVAREARKRCQNARWN